MLSFEMYFSKILSGGFFIGYEEGFFVLFDTNNKVLAKGKSLGSLMKEHKVNDRPVDRTENILAKRKP